MKNIIVRLFKNASVYKFKNARVAIGSIPEEKYCMQFRIFSNDPSPRAAHTVFKNKIVVTYLEISKEAALSVMLGLIDRLEKDGIIEYDEKKVIGHFV